MAIWDPPAELAILTYDGCAQSTVHGLTELFAVATNCARRHIGVNAPMLRVSHWAPNADTVSIDCVFDTHTALAHRIVAAIVPGSWKGEPDAGTKKQLGRWLAERHLAGATLCSVCGGAFILAETGLLAGRSATTHWDFTGQLAERYPDIRVDENRIVVEDGNFITAGGVLAWTDLALKLVDRHLGPTIMIETARYMLADPPGREQRYYSNFSPRLHHGDAAILKAQHWLQSRAASPPSISEMASVSGLEDRTFLRRFQKATGHKPTEYSQRLRVGKAREMLEFTNRSIDLIASSIGYEDPASFRKVFLRVVGMSPSAYRRRFAATGSGAPPANHGTAAV
jgi:transcriptional regulator GlxA family with amidase domain